MSEGTGEATLEVVVFVTTVKCSATGSLSGKDEDVDMIVVD
jgi:hypothetical protein